MQHDFVFLQSLETYIGSAMAKYVVNTLTDVSARLAEQQQQIQMLMDKATASTVEILDRTAEFEANHLERLKEIEEVVGAQSAERQRTTTALHTDLEKVQAQVGGWGEL